MTQLINGARLTGVHPLLIKVVELAVTRAPWDVAVIEGVRTLARQKELVAQGASKTMNSRHIPGADGLSKAVDIAPAPDGHPSWAWPLYDKLAPIMKQAAKDLNVTIEWGGDWASFKDGPHWQLPYKLFP